MPRSRSASPRRSASPDRKPKQWNQRRPKELSFYKRSAREYGQPSSGAAEPEEETAKERAQRRERGEVPRRFGGTRDQGVRNTMGNVQAASMGSLKRTVDRLGVKESGRERSERGGGDRERDRSDRERRDRDRDDPYYDRERGRRYERVDDGDYRRASDKADMRHPDRREEKEEKKIQQVSGSKVRVGRMIEVIANDRMGRKGESKLGGRVKRAHASAHQVHAVRHGGRPEEAHRRADGHERQQDPAQEGVYHVQGPCQARGLRDQRRDGG
jgi:ubiquitin-like protein 5